MRAAAVIAAVCVGMFFAGLAGYVCGYASCELAALRLARLKAPLLPAPPSRPVSVRVSCPFCGLSFMASGVGDQQDKGPSPWPTSVRGLIPVSCPHCQGRFQFNPRLTGMISADNPTVPKSDSK